MTEDAATPSPGIDWTGVMGALRQGNTPDGAATLDGGERLILNSASVQDCLKLSLRLVSPAHSL